MAKGHVKRHLVEPVLLSRTRYIGFAREPVRDDEESALITNLPEPASDYSLRDGGRWVDLRAKRK